MVDYVMIMRGYQFDALAYLRLMVFLSQLINHSYICLQFDIPGTDTRAEMERRQFWKTTEQEVFASISMKQENSLKIDDKLILILWNFNFLITLDRFSNELHRITIVNIYFMNDCWYFLLYTPKISFETFM